MLPHLHLAQMTPIFRGKSSNEVKNPLHTTTLWTIKLMAKSDQPPSIHRSLKGVMVSLNQLLLLRSSIISCRWDAGELKAFWDKISLGQKMHTATSILIIVSSYMCPIFIDRDKDATMKPCCHFLRPFWDW